MGRLGMLKNHYTRKAVAIHGSKSCEDKRNVNALKIHST